MGGGWAGWPRPQWNLGMPAARHPADWPAAAAILISLRSYGRRPSSSRRMIGQIKYGNQPRDTLNAALHVAGVPGSRCSVARPLKPPRLGTACCPGNQTQTRDKTCEKNRIFIGWWRQHYPVTP